MKTRKLTKQQAREALESLGPKVRLYGLVKHNGTWARYPAAYGENGRILTNVVIIHGQPVEFPVCKYELRYRENGKDTRPPVGTDSAAAEAERITVARQLAVKAAAEETSLKTLPEAPVVVPVDPTLTNAGNAKRVSQVEALAEYVEDCEEQEHMEEAELAGYCWAQFVKATQLEFLDQITRKSILRFHAALRERGLNPHTIAKKHSMLMRILRFGGLDPKKQKFPKTPIYELKLPTVYTSAQIKRIFAAADDFHRVAFKMLLQLGLRDKELRHAEFSDICWETKVFRVKGKPKYGFKMKDHEQRDIPIADDLLELLRRWKELHPGQSLIVPGNDGEPDPRLLYRLKTLANSAGLACGACKGCGQKQPQCADFTLHKFRRTCITGLLQAGIDIATVAKIAGHSDVKTTMRYLRPATVKVTHTVINSINWENCNIGL